MRMIDFHKKLKELDERFQQIKSQRSEIQLLDVNDEKEQLNQEIIELEKQIAYEHRKLFRNRFLRMRYKEKGLVEFSENEDFENFNRLLDLLEEKIQAYNKQ